MKNNKHLVIVCSIVPMLAEFVQAVPSAQALHSPAEGSTAPRSAAPQASQLRDSLIEGIVRRIYHQYRCPIAVGIIDRSGTTVFAAGRDRRGKPIDGNALFEAASVTKVFTGLLLAQSLLHREVRLDQPVKDIVPCYVPDFDGEPITLRQLATHMSGLPDWPTNRGSTAVPYSTGSLESYLKGAQRVDYPGDMTYSNTGYALLGYALATRMNTTFEQLCLQRICKPLGMNNTRVMPTNQMQLRIVGGHNKSGGRMRPSCPTAGGGADGLRTSANDLLKFVGAYAGVVPTRFPAALLLSYQIFEPINDQDDMGLAWYIRRPGGIVWKGGNIAGYRTYVGFQPQHHVGTVVLCGSNAVESQKVGEAVLKEMLIDACR